MITAPRKKRSDSESGVRLLVLYYYYYSQSAIWQLPRNAFPAVRADVAT